MNANQLQKIYDREEHFQIRVVWDAGFEVTLGDVLYDGIENCKTRYFKTAQQALDWLDSETKPTNSPQT